MRKPNVAQRAVDTLRTAPVGMAAVSVSVAPYVVEASVKGVDVFTYWEPYISFPLSVAGILWGIVESKVAFDVKRRVEKSLRKRGYNSNVLMPTVEYWCQRQAARTVCRRMGYLDKYETLCRESTGERHLAWLPHF